MGGCVCSKNSSTLNPFLPLYQKNQLIKVPIKDELRRGLIFGFIARLPIAEVLGYLGYEDEVLPIL